MKAHIFTALLAAAAPIAIADISLGSGAYLPSHEAIQPTSDEYLQTANDIINMFRELTTCLETVKDKASADAAAAQVATLLPRMAELQKKAESMPRPTVEMENQLRGLINVAEVQQIVSSFMNSFISICMSNAYGSQSLLDAMGPIMDMMPGNQE